MYILEEHKSRKEFTVNKMKKFFLIFPCSMEVLRPIDVLVLGALISYAGKNGKCYPGYAALANKTGITETTVKRTITRLRKHKFIKTQRPHSWANYNYTFLWNEYWEKCLISAKCYPKDSEGNHINYGDPFIPAGTVTGWRCPQSIAACVDMTPYERILLTYLYHNTRSNGNCYRSDVKIAHALGISGVSVRTLRIELERKGAIRRRVPANSNGVGAITAILHPHVQEDFETVGSTDRGKKAAIELAKVLTPEELVVKRWKESNDSSISENNNSKASAVPASATEEVVGREAEEEEVGESKKIDQILQEVIPPYYMQFVEKWFRAIPADIQGRDRVSIFLQIVHGKGIDNRAGYLYSLVQKARKGRYVCVDVRKRLIAFAKKAFSATRVAGIDPGPFPAAELGIGV